MDQTAYPDGIASAEAIGAPTVHVGIAAVGIASTEAIGTPFIASEACIAAHGYISLDGQAFYHAATPPVANGTIAIAGGAWMTAVPHGFTTMVAHGVIHIGSRARMSGGEALPAWVDPVPPWTGPDMTSDLTGMVVRAAGLKLRRPQITELTIELDNEGGPKAATLGVASTLDRAPALLKTLLVTYKGATLFDGRLEAVSTDLGSGMGYTLTYAGKLVSLRDRKDYRATFVDSDLDSWCTDQGPRSSPDTFEAASRSSGATV